tara:strand:- start:7197 stop:9611 length:2415 start_codon:yes stop_codon:yes gene_type:complete
MKVIVALMLIAICGYMGHEIWNSQKKDFREELVLNEDYLAGANDVVFWRPLSSSLNLCELPHWNSLSQPTGMGRFVEMLNKEFSKSGLAEDIGVKIFLIDKSFMAVVTGSSEVIETVTKGFFNVSVIPESMELVNADLRGRYSFGRLIVSPSLEIMTSVLAKAESQVALSFDESSELSWYSKSNAAKWFTHNEIGATGTSHVRFKKRNGFVYGYGFIPDSLVSPESVDLNYSIWDFQLPGKPSQFKIEQFPIRALDAEIIEAAEVECDCDARIAWKSWNTNQVYLFNQNGIEFYGLHCLEGVPARAGLYSFIADKAEMYKGYQLRSLISGTGVSGLYADMFGKEVSCFIDLEEQVFFFTSRVEAKAFINGIQNSSFNDIIAPEIQEFLLLSPNYTAYTSSAKGNTPIVYQFEKQDKGRYYHALWRADEREEFKVNSDNSEEQLAETIIANKWEKQTSGKVTQAPFVFTNHYTKEKEIAIISDHSRIIMLNSAGKELWSRGLPESISGKLHQVDLFRNNKFQLVFSTKNYLIALDRNGKDVENFPIKFSSPSSSAVSVMDYDGKGQNRLLVPLVDGSLKNYNCDGKEVNGWKHKAEESPIVSSVQHLILDRRDYLLAAKKNGEIAIYKRDGKLRYTQELKLSHYDGKEISILPSKTIEEVILIYGDTAGNLVQSKLSLEQNEGENLGLASAEKSIIYNLVDGSGPDFLMSKGTRLSLYSEKHELKFSTDFDSALTGALQCFSLNNKKYIIVNEGSNVYLLNTRGESYPGFPVYGGGRSVLVDLDKDGSLELITSDVQGLIICYEL